jgi:hypothetical protein
MRRWPATRPGYIWAVASLRPFDIVVGLILLTLLIVATGCSRPRRCARHFSAFSVTLLLMVVIRALFSKLPHMGWQHSSPSMVLDGACT